MRRVLPFILVAGLAAAFTGASAQTTPAAGTTSPAATATPAPADATGTPAVQNNEDIVSCRYEKTTGSLFSKRVCHTQREWHQMSVDSKALMDNIDDHNRNMGGSGGGN